jgi:Zn-dependent protease
LAQELGFFGLTLLNNAIGGPTAVAGVFTYLARLNTIVVLFNLIPAFPLDGGRVLRAGLWKARGSLRKATRNASWIGTVFAFTLIILGIMAFFGGGFIGGIWLVLIGLFLRGAAQASYQQLLVRQGPGG